MQLPEKLAERLVKLRGEKNWKEFVEEWVIEKEKRLEIQKRKLAEEKLQLEQMKPRPLKTASRHISNPIKFYVWARTDKKCEFPGCEREAKHLHHVERFALKKIHDPDTIVALCEAHHLKRPQFFLGSF